MGIDVTLGIITLCVSTGDFVLASLVALVFSRSAHHVASDKVDCDGNKCIEVCEQVHDVGHL